MIPTRSLLYCGALASVLALAACGMTPTASTSTAMTANLSGASEVPAVATSATGSVAASLNRQTSELSWTVTFSGLSGPLTAAHFHGPAMPGQNAGVALLIGGSMSSPLKGTATLTAAQVADLTAGKWYVNLHTAAHPNGEIRGQVGAGQ